MEWWQIPIVVYLVLTYALGIIICLCYLIAIDSARTNPGLGITIHGDPTKPYWPIALFWVAISPIFVPWWVMSAIKSGSSPLSLIIMLWWLVLLIKVKGGGKG